MSQINVTRMSRKDAKAATRQKLIDGAIALAREEGLAALTTGRIAAAAGLAQSSFYVHFPDRAACLREMGDAIGEMVVEQIRIAGEAFFGNIALTDLKTANRAFYAQVIEALMQDRELLEVFLKFRREISSPAGVGMRSIEMKARAQVVEQMSRFGLDRAFGESLSAYIDGSVGTLFGLAEGLVDGRIEKLDHAVDMMAKMTYPVFEAAVQNWMTQNRATAAIA